MVARLSDARGLGKLVACSRLSLHMGSAGKPEQQDRLRAKLALFALGEKGITAVYCLDDCGWFLFQPELATIPPRRTFEFNWNLKTDAILPVQSGGPVMRCAGAGFHAPFLSNARSAGAFPSVGAIIQRRLGDGARALVIGCPLIPLAPQLKLSSSQVPTPILRQFLLQQLGSWQLLLCMRL